MTTSTLTAAQIADRLSAAGTTYYGDRARAWTCDSHSRIYFGRDYVTIEHTGEVHNRKAGKARATTIGSGAVDLVESVIEG